MATFLVSDLHFGHKNILDYCKRPFSTTQEMEEAFVAEFQAKVKPNDMVYHLGDFIFHADYDEFNRIFNRLPGLWCFVLGNHDAHTIERWQGALRKNSRIFDITHIKRLKHEDTLSILCHYEMKSWEGQNFRTKQFNKYKAVYHFYGHYHGWPRKFALDTAEVGIDTTEMKLLTLEEHMDRAGKPKAEKEALDISPDFV